MDIVPAMSQEPTSAVAVPPAASATALGLSAFALNLFIISGSFTGVLPAQLVPLFLVSAIPFGLMMAWAGTHEYRIGNSYTGLVFGSFGAFLMGTGLLFLLVNTSILNFGTAFPKALGLYFVAWTILTLYLWVGTFFVNRIAFLVFSVLMITFILFDLWGFGVVSVKLGAWAGVVDALLAFYMAAAVMLADMTGRAVLPVGKALIS